MSTHFTESQCAKWAVAGETRRFYSDGEVRGFNFRVGVDGAASFTLTYRVHFRQRRYLMGHWPEMSVAEARNIAVDLRKAIRDGHDPLAEKALDREAPLVRDLARRYLEHAEKKNRASTLHNYKHMLDGVILPKLGRLRVDAVTSDDVERLHSSMRATPYRANRVLALLSVMFKHAVRWKMRADNPRIGVTPYPEEKHEEWLREHELERVERELEARAGKPAADALLLILLTGSRKGEVLSAQWREFDLDRGVWTKPSAHTKQKRIEHLPLNRKAIRLLTRMRHWTPDAPSDAFLFPGREEGSLSSINRMWREVSAAAGIARFRIHDLRHSFGSVLVSNGTSIEVVGKLLGHTQMQTTKRYAHLADQVVRDASDLFARKISEKR